ncbi:MAG: HD domain-containing protein [Longicatena sp.]
MNIETAKQAFHEYVKDYSLEDEKILLKVIHTEKVAQLCRQIARSLRLTREQQDLAELIGWLHDIGRFEQIRRYQTFLDSQSEDHALLGIRILQEQQFLRSFIEEDIYDEIIYTAIRNHNRFVVEDNLTQEELLYVNLIRDADKIDIFRVDCEESCELLFQCNPQQLKKETISKEVYEDVMKEKSVLAKKRKTPLDMYISHLALLFDMHFVESIQLVKQHGNYQTLRTMYTFENPTTKQQFQSIQEKIETYIEDKTKGL